MKLTKEQELILNTIRKSNSKIFKINAFAGSGKTTTLIELAKAFSNKKILYLAFNKSIQIEVKNKAPKNVIVKTTHSLAYQYIVKHFNYKVRHTEYKAFEISKILNKKNLKLAKLVEKNLVSFCNSSSLKMKLFIKLNEEEKNLKQDIINYSSKLFYKMLNKKLDITHNVYLKIFQLMLKKDTLSTQYFDLIMIDEAQDINNVTLSIFSNLKSNKKIAVGDIHQQIYSFRGSINAMRKIKGEIFYLTNSFRLNRDIALYASNFLSIFKGEEKQLIGLNNKVKKISTVAYITRTNSQLIEYIIHLIEDKTFFKTVREPYNIFGLVLNILNIIENKKVDRRFLFLDILYFEYLKSEKDIVSFLEYLENIGNDINDIELLSAIKIIKMYKNKIRFAYKITLNNFQSHQKAKIFLTTAHTSKGLEFDKIFIKGFNIEEKFISLLELMLDNYNKEFNKKFDFIGFWQEKLYSFLRPKDIDEFNLYYVAITRAKYEVVGDDFYYSLKSINKRNFNKKIFNILKRKKEIKNLFSNNV